MPDAPKTLTRAERDLRIAQANALYGTPEQLLAFAVAHGARGSGIKRTCPVCRAPDSFSTQRSADGDAVYMCAACGDVGDATILICNIRNVSLDEAADYILALPAAKKESARPVDGASAWASLSGASDADAWDWLRDRGLDGLVDRDLVRFNTGDTGEDYVDWLARDGWRLAFPLLNADGAVVSFQAQHVGASARPAPRQGDGTPFPERMGLRGAPRTCWFGTPHFAPAADVVYVLEGLDTLAVMASGITDTHEDAHRAVIGATSLSALLGVLPQLGVISPRRVFVLCPRRDDTGESQAAFDRLRTAIAGNGGTVRVLFPPQTDDVRLPDMVSFMRVRGAAAVRDALRAAGAPAEPVKSSGGALAPVVPIFGGGGPDELGKFKPFALTDVGNGERMAQRHGDDIAFVAAWASWRTWEGSRWVDDVGGEYGCRVVQLAVDTARHIKDETHWTPSPDEKGEIEKWAKDSESASRIRSMIWMARTMPDMAVRPDDFDKDPWLFNCSNGTLDLRTRELRPHSRDDLLSKEAPIAYDPAATCPRWEQFLLEIMSGDPELVAFIQRAVGYSLTGITREHCLFLLHGEGRNGKGTFRNVLRALMGEYAHEAEFSTFEPDKSNPGAPREDIVALMGKRFVSASEQEESKNVDEALIKKLTGEDVMRARKLHKDGFEFKPIAKYWLLVNHLPVIRGTDRGIWARMRKIPFDVSFEGREDRGLESALLAELPGVLNWALDGCAAWQHHGLVPPRAVIEATEAYRDAMDVFGQWLGDGAWIVNKIRSSVVEFVATKDLFDQYLAWCERNKIRPRTIQWFGRELGSRSARIGIKQGRNGDDRGWELLTAAQAPMWTGD